MQQWKESINIQEPPFSIMNASFDFTPPIWETSSLSPETFRKYFNTLKQSKDSEFEWDPTLLSGS